MGLEMFWARLNGQALSGGMDSGAGVGRGGGCVPCGLRAPDGVTSQTCSGGVGGRQDAAVDDLHGGFQTVEPTATPGRSSNTARS